MVSSSLVTPSGVLEAEKPGQERRGYRSWFCLLPCPPLWFSGVTAHLSESLNNIVSFHLLFSYNKNKLLVNLEKRRDMGGPVLLKLEVSKSTENNLYLFLSSTNNLLPFFSCGHISISHTYAESFLILSINISYNFVTTSSPESYTFICCNVYFLPVSWLTEWSYNNTSFLFFSFFFRGKEERGEKGRAGREKRGREERRGKEKKFSSFSVTATEL